ncbi:hypothetical protein EKK58_01585 [Candidatus Dependentiae bacterium]|nr:MAG: hypothetical protein EKK58_01585 [Candidatus Dependentiae bacterium]
MKNIFFWYLTIIGYCQTFIPSNPAYQLATRLETFVYKYLEPADRQIPDSAFAYNIQLLFEYTDKKYPPNQSTEQMEESCKAKKNALFLSSLPTINLLMQLAYKVYPIDFFTIHANKMALSTAYFCFIGISQFYTEDQWLCNIANTICSLGLCTIAKNKNASLFSTYTYMSLFDLFDDYLSTMQCKPIYIATRYFHTVLHNQIMNYSLIRKIDYLFETKKTMFLCAMILACFNIKIKNNNLLTNPLYWLPIGLAHMFFTHYKWTNIESSKDECLYESFLLQTMNNVGIPFNDQSCVHLLAKNIFYNAVPILAVLLNTAFYF